MKIHVMSDLHLEHRPTEDYALPETDADVIVLAGDTRPGTRGAEWAMAATDKPVIYVLGNHEYYRSSYPSLIGKLMEMTKGTNVHVLENRRVDIDDVSFLGCTLWTDMGLYGDVNMASMRAEYRMNDYSLIRNSSREHARFSARDSRAASAASARWLSKEFESGDCMPRRVVVTHHAPSEQSISVRYKGDDTNPAYASDYEHLVRSSGAAYWIHGHVHRSLRYEIGDTTVLANPRGYPRESGYSGFDPKIVIEV